MTNIHAIVVTKNEEHRYLYSFLEHHLPLFDSIFVYDDRSDDNTAQICADAGCVTVVRGSSSPAFMEHEGRFRFNSWHAFEDKIRPHPQDWVFAIDADEFLVADKDVKTLLHTAVTGAERQGRLSVLIQRPEIWKYDNGQFFTRQDGFWNQIKCTRLFRYRYGATWNMKPMGCGSEPEYVASNLCSTNNLGLRLLHFGYMRDVDKQEKYNRYISLPNHGHNVNHLKSIIGPTKLELWEGSVPRFSDSEIYG